MSWLMRRARPWAFAGWRDDFNRSNESPVGKPWAVWGATPCTAQIVSNKLVFGNANTFFDFGGWSFEHTCFTDNWGTSFDLGALRTGATAEIFRAIINKESWTAVNSSLSNVLGVDIQYRTSAVGSRVMLTTYASAGSAGTVLAEASIPQAAFDGTLHNWTIKVDQDWYVRIYYDGVLKLAAVVGDPYRPAPGRRSVNFMNQMGTNVTLDTFVLFDQFPDPPWRAYDWESAFADTFNRSDGPVSNGWTEIGSNDRARIVSNSYSFNGTTDGSRGIVRSTGASNGRQRATAVIGGNNAPAGQDASLVIRSNSAGSSALTANIFNNHVYLSRLTNAMSNDNPGFTDLSDAGLTVSSGDIVTLAAAEDWAWVEVNGWVVATASGVDALVPTSQAYAGLRVERHSFTNSASWNSVELFTDA